MMKKLVVMMKRLVVMMRRSVVRVLGKTRQLLDRVMWSRYVRSIPKRIYSTSKSDNQSYPQVCLRASNDYRVFNNFRRNPIYNQILEHVTKGQGVSYLKIISRDNEILEAINMFKSNDLYGDPRRFTYPKIGEISPTTLRYIKVLTDLKSLFHPLDGMDVCEIGVGYGGQCRIINAFYQPATYCLVDIQPALALAQRFLGNYIINSVLEYKTLNELPLKQYDLVLSNYAFTELRREFQDAYLAKVISRSKRGYITYNDVTPPEFNSYNLDELLSLIPGSNVLNQEPKLHPETCIIVWGADDYA